MSVEQEPDGMHRSGWSHAAVDALVALAIFLIGVVMMVDNHRIGAGWAPDGPESGYFPFRIGAILCIASAWVILRSLFGRRRQRQVFVSWQRFRLVLLVLIPTGFYVLAIQLAGIYVASAIFIAAFMRAMDKYSWLKTVLIGAGVSVTMFWMFEVQFMVPLPKGPIEALFGY